MLSTTLLLAAALAPQGTGTSNAPVVVNEFSYDDSGADNLEFVELYNRSGADVDLTGWTVVGDDSNGVNFTTSFAAGTVLAKGDYLVIGNTAVPNVDIIESAGFLQNSNESITIFDNNGRIIDTLIYEANKGVFNTTLAEGEGIWGNHALIEGAGEMSWARLADGYDTDDNGDDFRMQRWSPGTSNNQPGIGQLFETYDTATVGDDAAGWDGSFVAPRIIDPTVADANNPNAIAASPIGGNALICWDPSGGGDAAAHVSAPGTSSTFETYIYIDSTLLGPGFNESWSIGFGTTGTFYNTPDPLGNFGFTAAGMTGVAWTFQRTELSADLVLVDYNNGGAGANALSGPTVLGQISVTPGTNDGWQRLLLTIDAGQITGRFGGTYGQADGTVFNGTTSAKARGFHIGYREFLDPNSLARPVTIDGLALQQCGPANSRNFGTATDTSAATTPAIAATNEAVLGGVLTGSITGMLPNSNGIVLFGLELPAPITFGPILNPGASLWVASFGDIGIATDGSGASSFGLPVLNDRALCGAELAWQALQLDAGLTGGLIGLNHTDGLVTVIGL